MVGKPQPSIFRGSAPARAGSRCAVLSFALVFLVLVFAPLSLTGAETPDPSLGPVDLKAGASRPAESATCEGRDCVVALPAVTPLGVMVMMMMMMGASSAVFYWGLLQPRTVSVRLADGEQNRSKAKPSRPRWTIRHAKQRSLRRQSARGSNQGRRRADRGHLTVSRARKRRDGPGCRD